MFNEKRFRLKVHQYGPGGEGEGGGGSPGGPGGPGGTGPSGGGGGGYGGGGEFGAFGSGFGGLGLGDAGAFGGAFGGTSGGFFGNLFSNYSRQDQRSDIDTILNMNPLTAIMNAIVYGGTLATTGKGQTFGDLAQGDPSGTGPTGGPGGVVSPGSTTLRAITQALAPPPAPVAPPPVAPPLADDRKRKRVGRQETILTSRSALSDAPTFRPTLLGQ